MNKSSKLFTPVRAGALELSHRIVMPPLTRLRADLPGDLPSALMMEYYFQRATEGGLLVTEATSVSTDGRAYYGAPGFFNDAQIPAWKKVVDAVHAKGARFFNQLWHGGRVSHSSLSEGRTPVAPSEVLFEGGQAFTQHGWMAVSPARALEVDEIHGIVEEFRAAARRAKEAGFDGVELHGANGYLIDQFLQDNTNKRTDRYGGPVENRARFLLEVVEAVASVFGADRVGVRISPASKFNAMADSNPQATFGHVAKELNRFGLAYLHVIEPRIDGFTLIEAGLEPVAARTLRQVFRGTLIAAGGFEPDTAEEIVAKGDADLVAFGRHFIANPDLVWRIQNGVNLNSYDRDSFYGGGAKGYIDYPFYPVLQG